MSSQEKEIISVLGITLTEHDAVRFWNKVNKGDTDECWVWGGAIHRLGYGQFKIGGKKGKVAASHRIAAALVLSDFDETLCCLHSCDNRGCCNPSHLRMGTQQENIEEMVSKKRNKTSRIGNGHEKISFAEHTQIKQLFFEGKNKSEIARMYNVTPSRIRQILSNYI